MSMHHFTTDRQFRWLALGLCLAVLAACSFKTIYNRADTLMLEYVEGLVTLDDALENQVERRTAAILAWHRQDQLDEYAALFRTLQREFNPELSPQRMLQHINTIEAFWMALMHRLDTDMAELLPQLDARQQRELFSALDGKNRRFKDKFVDLDEEERRETYIERMQETYEDWMGDLDDNQLAMIESAAGRLQTSAPGRLIARKRWQGKIQQILSSGLSQQQKSVQLGEYFEQFKVNRMPMVRPIYRSNKRVIAELTVELVRSASPQQRLIFMHETDEYIRIFNELKSEI